MVFKYTSVNRTRMEKIKMVFKYTSFNRTKNQTLYTIDICDTQHLVLVSFFIIY